MKQVVSCAAVLLVTAGLTVGLAGSAHASTILKTAAFYANGTDSVSCSATNVSSSQLESLAVWMIDDAGAPVAVNVCHDVTSGGMCTTSVDAPKGGYCAIVFSGSSRNVRGSICILDKDGNARTALPAQ